jgi:imidazolonepropionase-like amidohydrolase
MKKFLLGAAGIAFSIASLALLFLTNTGILDTRKPYITQISGERIGESGTAAFVRVNVVPMDSERVLLNQTVIVRDGLIDQIGDHAIVAVPLNTRVIEADGLYLMPGLVDMHVHVKEENELLLFVANGVTAVRDMWGTTGFQLWLGFPDQLELRDKISQGRLLGPTMYAAGPIMEGEPATMPLMPVFRTSEAARESVAWQKRQGYEFIKVYDNLTPDTYEAILGAAQVYDLPVIGHVPWQVGLDAVLAGNQHSIEHLSGYIDPEAVAFLIPEDRLQHYAILTGQAGVWNVPTIALYQKIGPGSDRQQLENQPGMEYVSPRMRVLWRLFARQMSRSLTYEGPDYPSRIDEIYKRMTRALHENEAGILLGTDTGNPYLVPGFSLHEELAHLVDAGLSPFEALAAGSRNAAEALGRGHEFGTVEPGKRADLLLLQANPLDDVANANRRVGVMLRGQWFTDSELQEMLLELKASHSPAAVDRLWPAALLFLGLLISARSLLKMP